MNTHKDTSKTSPPALHDTYMVDVPYLLPFCADSHGPAVRLHSLFVCCPIFLTLKGSEDTDLESKLNSGAVFH